MPAPAILLSGRLKYAVYSAPADDGPVIVIPEVPTFSIGSSFASVSTSTSGTTTATFTIGRAGGLLLAGSVGYKVTGLDGAWFSSGAAPDTTVDFSVGDTRKEVSITFAAKDLPDSELTGTVTLYVSLLGGLLGGTASFSFKIPKKVTTPGTRNFSLGTNSAWLFESFDARLGLYLERTFSLTDYGSEVSTTAELQTALDTAAANTRIRVKSGTSFGNVTYNRNLSSGWIMVDGQPDLTGKRLKATCTGTITSSNGTSTANGLVIRGIDFAAVTGTKTNPAASRVLVNGSRFVMQRCRIENSRYVEFLVQLGQGARADITIELNTFKSFDDHAIHSNSIANSADQGIVIAYNLMEDAKGGWQPNTPGNDPSVCIYLGDNLGSNNPNRQTKAVCYNWFESVATEGNARGILECKHPRLAFFGNVYRKGTGDPISANARGCFGHLWLCNDLDGDISLRGRGSAVLWNRLRGPKAVTVQYGNYDQENDSFLNDVGNGSFPGSASPRPAGTTAKLFGNVCDGPIVLGGDVHNDIPNSGSFTSARPCRGVVVKNHTVSSGPMYVSVTGESAAGAQSYSNGNVDSAFNSASSHTLTPTDTTVPAGLRKPDIPVITKDMCGCFGDQSSLGGDTVEPPVAGDAYTFGDDATVNYAVHMGDNTGSRSKPATGAVQLQGGPIGNVQGGIRLYNRTSLSKPASGTPLKFQWKFKRLLIPTSTTSSGCFNFVGFVANTDGTFPGSNSGATTQDDSLLSTLKGWRITYGNDNDSNTDLANKFRLQVYKGDGTKYSVDPGETAVAADLGLNTEHTMTVAVVGNTVTMKCTDLSLTQTFTDPGINGFTTGYLMFYTSYGAKSIISAVSKVS